MNRAQLMLEVLRDGKPHARREIFERAGFMLTNNAASELRAQGYDVRQSSERIDGQTVYSYQLHGSLSEGESTSRVGLVDDRAEISSGSTPEARPSPSESQHEQLRIEAA